MSNELGEVVEGVDAVELGSVDEAEENISDVGAVFRLDEQGVFAMQNGFFSKSVHTDYCRWVRLAPSGIV